MSIPDDTVLGVTRDSPAQWAAKPLYSLSDQAFEHFRKFLLDTSGITLSDQKKTMVVARLSRRLRDHNLTCFNEYIELISSGALPNERQVVLNLLTTNETYFFREPMHFQYLAERILPEHQTSRPLRIWSAASSSGEEAYSIAMLLADKLGNNPWEVFGSDISTRVLEKARSGHYRMERIDGIPQEYLKRFCLKGTGEYADTLLIDRSLRERVSFQEINLMQPIQGIGQFDVIFLRNVLIYFDTKTKGQVVARMLPLLKPGGYFIIGHSESLKGINDDLKPVAPTIYRKPLSNSK